MKDARENRLRELQGRYDRMRLKDKLEIERQPMPEQDPEVRRRNMEEVPLGFDEIAARLEAMRCCCTKRSCVKGCPVKIDIPGFIDHMRKGDFASALAVVREANCLPAVTGRVCPQEKQCQLRCTVGKAKKDVAESVSIGRLERFLADWERAQGHQQVPERPPPTGKRVAVVGSGPAGLAAAGDLVRMGHAVTVFEAFHKMGGVLVYGIPEFRLPKEIVRSEIDYLEKSGVEFCPNMVVGRTVTVDELLEEEGYHAVFLAVGAGLPYFMNIPGEGLLGVYSANEYLTRVNLMEAYRFPLSDTPPVRSRNVAVFGGGNVAMDSARTALRMGAEKVYLIYRRSMEEMPARVEEVKHAEEEGVQFLLLTQPVEILSDDRGWARGVRVLGMELGEPDASGRRRPAPVEGSEYDIRVDTVIEAVGNGPNPLVTATTPGLEAKAQGTLRVDETTMKTSKRGVFAGGDVVSGAATVILAMGQGRQAAQAIHEYLVYEPELSSVTGLSDTW